MPHDSYPCLGTNACSIVYKAIALNHFEVDTKFVFCRSKKSQSGKPMMAGRPDLRAMNENKASNECLAFMIAHVSDLFKVGCSM